MIPYKFHIFWSAEDTEWVATCAQYPSLSHLSDDPRVALQGLLDLLDDVAEMND